MGLLDRFLRKKDAEVQSRPVVAAKKSYQAASLSNLTASWTTEDIGADDTVYRTLKVLRARSREQYKNNDYARRFVGLMKSNIVGDKGVVIQSTPMDFRGGKSTVDQVAASALERSFNKWTRRESCDISGVLDFIEFQRILVASMATDGEFFVRKHKLQPLMLEAMDPVLFDIEHNRELADGHKIRFSIEYDRNNRPVAYYPRRKKGEVFPGDYVYSGQAYEQIPAGDMIHGFISEMVGQKRGIPMMGTALMRMNMLGGYEDAAITAARVGASKMGFFKSPSGDGYTGTDTESDGTVVTDVEPGVFEQLPEGMDFVPFDPDYPHAQFGDFVKTCLRGISSGLGVSYNTLSNDLEGVNFSSIRSGVLEDRELWKALQDWFVSVFIRPVFESWIDRAIPLGVSIPSGGTLRASDIEKYKDASYQPRRWAWVDPQKDTAANVDAINNGLKSRAEVIREQGRDPETVWRELEEEKERLKDILTETQSTVMEAENAEA